MPSVDQAFGEGTDQPGLHVTLEIAAEPRQVPARPGRAASTSDKRGPRCYDLVPADPFPQYPPDGPITDGSQPTPARAAATALTGRHAGERGPTSRGASAVGLANSPEEQQLIASCWRRSVGVPPQRGARLGQPAARAALRGTEVTLK